MTSESGERENGDDAERDDTDTASAESGPGQRQRTPENGVPPKDDSVDEDEEDEVEDEEEEEDEDEDEEPELKYARLTGRLGGVYRNGDATSAFLVAGDKMIIGTHNGNLHVYAIPTFQQLRVYHAHSASITAISIAPFPPPAPSGRSDAVARVVSQAHESARKPPSNSSKTSPSSKNPGQPLLPLTPSNAIHIATSSIDGNVCVASLVDPKDVLLRNFARPVQSVALSPDFRSDRSYLSGGLAGKLVLTMGGRAGTSSTASTSGGTAAAASGWLGSIGLSSNTAKDVVLHSGEGPISTVKWSLSGRFVVWINEKGIKIMRSNLRLESNESDFAWKRIAHVDHPYGQKWDEMSGVWKGRAEWIDMAGLEPDEESQVEKGTTKKAISRPKQIEKLVVGWGDTAWIVDVHHGWTGTGKDVGERSVGRAEIIIKTQLEDCIISGLSLYTPSLLVVLAYDASGDIIDAEDPPRPASQASKGKQSNASTGTTPKRGIQHRSNALEPELRLIDFSRSGEEADISADSLTMSRFEGLSATDYHLGVLPSSRHSNEDIAQGYSFAGLGSGLWNASVNATKVFGSNASSKSHDSHSEEAASSRGTSKISAEAAGRNQAGSQSSQEAHPAAASSGMKIYIHSPYDCVLATKRELSDQLKWLMEREKFQQSWELVDAHPEAIRSASPETLLKSSPSTPTRKRSSEDFFADNSFVKPLSTDQAVNSAVEKEKRRIGEQWIQQLVTAGAWEMAGRVCGKVLGTSSRWEHWVWVFAQANRFEEITPFIPTKQIKPSLPPLVYELVLGHYVSRNRLRLKELLEQWPPDIFDAKSVSDAIETKLNSGEIREDSVEDGETGRDWRILMEGLGRLLMADRRPREALRCFIRLQDADTALKLIREHRILDAVSDDIAGLIHLRVSKQQLREAPMSEIEDATSEVLELLVDEAQHGLVRSELVVSQLQEQDHTFFLFLYLRALWKGGSATEKHGRVDPLVVESKSLVEDFADVVVELFAEYDRPLFMDFLKSSQSYSFDKASDVCEHRHYIPELVYLFSKTGQTKRALKLIIDRLGDVSQAIAFAKEQDDAVLWDDLLEYSMDKPRFIRGLLEEVGTAINPIKLVRRIPDGLEIEGLRDGLIRMLREYEIQDSISEGVARVLRGEVALSMDTLRAGQKKGVKFHVAEDFRHRPSDATDGSTKEHPAVSTINGEANSRPGHCLGCGTAFPEDGTIDLDSDPSTLLTSKAEKETLVGFACGHVFHLSCLLEFRADAGDKDVPDIGAELLYGSNDAGSVTRNVGAKVTHARIIRDRIGGGCPSPVHQQEV
ncbi:MAG: Vacuolar protein sorting-associated protein 41 [Piccolia ochrophora]|nr:MAG: Vacuolar protein sorting-associated protein 41 [Piccolia ochrophora]